MVNSDYCNNAGRAKNCYLMFNFVDSENCRYGARVSQTKDSMDILSVDKSELVYESFEIHGSSKVFYSENCENCVDVYFSKNLSNCNNCYGCSNLRGKSYCIFNEQYSREEYLSKLAEFDLGSRSFVQKEATKFRDFWMRHPEKYLHGVSNQNVSGEYIYSSKNVKDSYIIEGGENIRYSQYLYTPTSKDAYDHTNWGEGSELTYECLQVGMNVRNVRFSAHCWPGLRDAEYSIYCMSSSNLFGCVGVRSGQYCILNKQYTPEEYAALVPKIREHMREMPYTDRVGRVYSYGEFFPYEVCPWGYNETVAQEFFPLSKEAASQRGFNWKEDQKREHEPTVAAADIPDNIEDVKDEITSEIIACSHGGDCEHHCTSAFKVLPDDLAFYKRLNIPIPDLCPNCRHYRRASLRNPMQTWHRKCQCSGSASENGKYKNLDQAHASHALADPCPNEFETSYAPDRPEIVYCEKCYQAELA
jgi:hypothetical protein